MTSGKARWGHLRWALFVALVALVIGAGYIPEDVESELRDMAQSTSAMPDSELRERVGPFTTMKAGFANAFVTKRSLDEVLRFYRDLMASHGFQEVGPAVHSDGAASTTWRKGGFRAELECHATTNGMATCVVSATWLRLRTPAACGPRAGPVPDMP